MEEIVQCHYCNGKGCSHCNNVGFYYKKDNQLYTVYMDAKGEPQLGDPVAEEPTPQVSTKNGFWNIIFNSFTEPKDLLWFLKKIKRARS